MSDDIDRLVNWQLTSSPAALVEHQPSCGLALARRIAEALWHETPTPGAL